MSQKYTNASFDFDFFDFWSFNWLLINELSETWFYSLMQIKWNEENLH